MDQTQELTEFYHNAPQMGGQLFFVEDVSQLRARSSPQESTQESFHVIKSYINYASNLARNRSMQWFPRIQTGPEQSHAEQIIQFYKTQLLNIATWYMEDSRRLLICKDISIEQIASIMTRYNQPTMWSERTLTCLLCLTSTSINIFWLCTDN